MATYLLSFLGTVGFLTAFFYHYLTTNPNVAVKFANFVNNFDDQTLVNLQQNQFLKGVYAPVSNENRNVPMKVIEGSLPTDFEGLFLRIGPNPIATHLDRGYHWFDGHGMIHAIRIKNGEATYSNQWIDTVSYRLSRKYDQSIFVRLGEITGFVGLLKVIAVAPILLKAFGISSSIYVGEANTALLFYKNRLFACFEASLPVELHLREDNSFETIGVADFNKKLDFPFTAHGKIDPTDGTLYFDGYSVDPLQPAYKYGKIVDEEVKSYFGVPSNTRSFSHDMMITERYVLIFESSADYDIKRIVTGDMFRMNAANMFRIGVIDKSAERSDQVRWFNFNRPLAMIHALNAWEEGNEIVLYSPLGTDFNGLDARNGTISDQYQMAELRINLDSAETAVNFFAGGEYIEFPNIHPSFLGKRAQFGFAGEFAGNNQFIFKNIVKFDLFKKSVVAKIALPDGWLSGEPVLIPKSSSRGDETDGSDAVYIACVAYNIAENASQWFLYDGESMDNTPLARLEATDIRIPMGYHGLFLNENDLRAHFQRNKSA